MPAGETLNRGPDGILARDQASVLYQTADVVQKPQLSTGNSVNGMEKQRLDKWLWAARFFKTRTVAGEAIKKGRIAVDGQRVKPSRMVSVGDTVTITRSPFQHTVVVLGLNEYRRPAVEAVMLYQETADSVEARQLLAEKLRDDRVISQGLKGEGRPDKRKRRQIIRFRSNASTDNGDTAGSGNSMVGRSRVSVDKTGKKNDR